MASGFAPEFLILLGIDIFLGASILTVLLDKHFPSALPYVLEGASLIGFAELMAGPSFLNSLAVELQFYYSFAYAMIAVMTLLATNLYLLFLKRRPFESAMIGLVGTIPSGLGILYFTSAFVNGLSLSLPIIPVIPIEGVYIMFGLSIALVVFSLLVFGRKMRTVVEESPVHERPLMEPIISRASPESGQVVLLQQAPLPTTAPGPNMPVPKETEALSAPNPPVTPPREGGSGEAKAEKSGIGGAIQATPSGVAHGSTGPLEEPPSTNGDPSPSPTGDGGIQNAGTVLVKKVEQTDYTKRLVDSIRFFERAVDHPVRIDPSSLGGTMRGAKRAYLTPAGMIMVEDSTGKTISLSLMDLATDEALKVMREAMKGIKDREDMP